MKKQVLHPRTALINASQKKQSKKIRCQALTWLETTFPQAFDSKLRIRPLQIGILDAVLEQADKALEAGISKSKLREALVVFTRRLDYLVCLKAREMRIDLQGNPTTQVTEEEAVSAAAKVKKRVENHSRNAKKLLAEGAAPTYHSYPKPEQMKAPAALTIQESFPVYPARASRVDISQSAAPKQATVTVKHKATRAYDPNAVARLKEKLGLSQNTERLPE